MPWPARKKAFFTVPERLAVGDHEGIIQPW
jgi:hypothetical protein